MRSGGLIMTGCVAGTLLFCVSGGARGEVGTVTPLDIRSQIKPSQQARVEVVHETPDLAMVRAEIARLQKDMAELKQLETVLRHELKAAQRELTRSQ